MSVMTYKSNKFSQILQSLLILWILKWIQKIYLFFCIELLIAELPTATSIPNCQDTVNVEPGCEIVDRKCRCWNSRVQICREHEIKWDFKDSEVRLYQFLNTFLFLCFIHVIDYFFLVGVWTESSKFS